MFELDKSVIDTIFSGLKESGLSMRQKKYLGLLETKIQELTTHPETRGSYLYDTLTPTEIKIVGLIRTGITSKEIASLLNIATRTVEVHRCNIRNKLSIRNKKVNLRTYLMNN